MQSCLVISKLQFQGGPGRLPYGKQLTAVNRLLAAPTAAISSPGKMYQAPTPDRIRPNFRRSRRQGPCLHPALQASLANVSRATTGCRRHQRWTNPAHRCRPPGNLFLSADRSGLISRYPTSRMVFMARLTLRNQRLIRQDKARYEIGRAARVHLSFRIVHKRRGDILGTR